MQLHRGLNAFAMINVEYVLLIDLQAIMFDRYASVEQRVRPNHSLRTDGFLPTSDRCASNHVPPLGRGDR